MPNGGEHFERLGVCPLCGSPSIRIRRGRHRRPLWRCRRCNRVFGTPKVAECIIPPGHDGSGLVYAESIPQMEQRSRRRVSRGDRFFRHAFTRRATTVAVLVLLLGAIGYLIFMSGLGRDSDEIDQWPGVDESLSPTGFQSPTPRSTPPVTNAPTPNSPATARAIQASMATATPTEPPVAASPTDIPTPSNISTLLPSATSAPVPSATPTPTPTDTSTPVPSATPTPTPTLTSKPQPTLTSLHNTQNTRWLERNYPVLASQISNLAWVADGLSGLEGSTIDKLLYIGAGKITDLEAVLRLPWVQDSISDKEHETIERLGALEYETPANLSMVVALPWVQDAISKIEHDIIDRLATLDYHDPQATSEILAMPFLNSPDPTDVLAISGMTGLAWAGHLSALTEHSVFREGITEAETTLIAAVGTLGDEPDEIQRVLEPGAAAVETVALSTRLTPNLRISIVRTDSQSRPATIETTRDLIEFIEDTIGLPLPVDHVIIILNEKAAIPGYGGGHYGFAFSFKPEYEQRDTSGWSGLVHEIAHYYWAGSEGWISEGTANIIEYLFSRENGLSRGQLQPGRGNCEAHDLAMLSEWNPSSEDKPEYGCTYYLGQLFFQELLESMGEEAFTAGLRELNQLALEEQEAGRTTGIAQVRQAFGEQAAVIDRRWSGGLNAPENRPFDEGIERPMHDLIEWVQYPTYDGRSVSFEVAMLGDSILAETAGFLNFYLDSAATGGFVGFILPPLEGGAQWTLDNPGDAVATTYRSVTTAGTRSFIVEFPYPQKLDGAPSDYVVTVAGFQDASGTTTIAAQGVDLLGYARIRVP